MMLRPTLIAVLCATVTPSLAQESGAPVSDAPAAEPGPATGPAFSKDGTVAQSQLPADPDDAGDRPVLQADAPLGAGGQDAAQPGRAEPLQITGPLIRADDVGDARVYSLAQTYDQTFWDSGEPFGPVAASWNEIGEVEDLVLDNSGQVVGVTVDVGGFLGMGETTVLIPLPDLRLVQVPDDDDFFIVTRLSREQLEETEPVGSLVGED